MPPSGWSGRPRRAWRKNKKGKMNVAFTIKADGRVGGARCTSPEFANTPVATCVIKVVNGMKFRASGSETPITYPFQIQ